MINYREHIEIDTNVRFGRPVIKGTRISVSEVLNWLANEMSIAEILEDYPQLKKEAIQSCLLYAADKEHNIRIAS